MTRKDYVAIAAAMNKAFNTCRHNGSTATMAWAETVHELAMVLAADNPRFDRERFTNACRGVVS